MDLAKIIQTFKDHPDYHKIGMIASHLGVVRENSLDGRKVRGIEIVFDRDMIDKIISETIEMQGIYQVMVEVSEGKLEVGDEIMAVVVGGDTREHVFPALIETVNRIKVQGGRKKEIF
ncbi:MAG: molybdenum cofactor biosynthesis protein MoaE [Deltaproteobacteria bacterium]|nr:molybdenum cofactor biosynthesis protein MoaE [Deltaproteobacteria bacterium]MBW1908753.1 molybdenum cofactor biosynthesis protein MoaE [Deltaproteobacteria bacterium]MBW2170015.1 molybdenum cofactor biosynthesis protein MoaE [Deltaproteobacteria bacterium]